HLLEARRKPFQGRRAIDQSPRHDDLLDELTRPFDVHHSNAARAAAADGLPDLWIAKGADIACALELLLVEVHGPRYVNGEDELEIDRLIGPRWRGPANSQHHCEQGDDAYAKCPHRGIDAWGN